MMQTGAPAVQQNCTLTHIREKNEYLQLQTGGSHGQGRQSFVMCELEIPNFQNKRGLASKELVAKMVGMDLISYGSCAVYWIG